MAKSILITGKQGSGKTTKMKELMYTNYSQSIELAYPIFKKASKLELKKKYDVIAIDGVAYDNELRYMLKVKADFDLPLIITTQLPIEELKGFDLSEFDVLLCTLNFQTINTQLK